MDTLTSTLDPETKEPYHPSILAAMELARKKMNRYYSLTDEAAPYRIAMGKSDSILISRMGTNLTNQSFIPDSNSSTFANTNGRKSGSSGQRRWCAKNTLQIMKRPRRHLIR